MLSRRSARNQETEPSQPEQPGDIPDLVSELQVDGRHYDSGRRLGHGEGALLWFVLGAVTVQAGIMLGNCAAHSRDTKMTAILQQKGLLRHNNFPGLLNAATVRLEGFCDSARANSSHPLLLFQGTGAIYKTDGVYRIGTISHVVDQMLPQNCTFDVTIPGKAPLGFNVPATSFRSTYTRPAIAWAATDQPVFADVPSAYVDKLRTKEAEGELTPLEPAASSSGKGFIYYRTNLLDSAASPGKPPMALTGEVSLAVNDDQMMSYTMLEGNACPGNSGSPVLVEDAHGQPTNRVIGLLKTTEPKGLDLCGAIGDVIGFQL